MLLAFFATTATADWQLVDEGPCDGPILLMSDGLEPDPARCTPEQKGKAALCYTELCQPHCLYFDHDLTQCLQGLAQGKRYVCNPE